MQPYNLRRSREATSKIFQRYVNNTHAPTHRRGASVRAFENCAHKKMKSETDGVGEELLFSLFTLRRTSRSTSLLRKTPPPSALIRRETLAHQTISQTMYLPRRCVASVVLNRSTVSNCKIRVIVCFFLSCVTKCLKVVNEKIHFTHL